MFKSWFDIVIEKQMSVGDALAFMGLNNNVSKTDVDKRYKELSKKYHPDLGGNPEDMKTLNQAREILSKVKFTSSDIYESARSKYEDEIRTVENFAREYLNKMNIEKYNRYLNDIFSENFSYKEESKAKYQFSYKEVEFYNADRSKIFKLHISLDTEGIYKALFGDKKVISEKDMSFKIWLSSVIFLDGKKQILTKERYVSSNSSDWFDNPEILLPKARLEKLATGTVRKGKVSKKDFVTMITLKHGGETGDNKWFSIYSNNKDYRLDISRIPLTFGRLKTVSYHFDGIYKRIDGKMNKFLPSMDLGKYGVESKRSQSFEENEENLRIWDELIGKFKKVENDNDLDKWMKLLVSEIKKLTLFD